jgi:DNA polymerase III epsilon subunit-like protein
MTSPDPFTRLADVTFCVLDLETTGTSDEVDEIVEIGAVKVRGGVRVGTFQTMVRHSLAVGSVDRPRIEPVLASLLEFAHGSVVVGHNIRFDLRFLNAALWRAGRDDQFDPARAIDTMVLARRLLRDDADDCRLGTLAQRFAFDERPTHRALADASATVELLHLVIERATHYGVFDLDDLVRLPSLMRHRHRARLAATVAVPRVAGVARLVDRSGQVLHVVDGRDLRHEVRRLFDLDDVAVAHPVAANVLQQLHRIEHLDIEHSVAAEIAALRWRSTTPAARRVPQAYLRRPATGAGRLVVSGDRTARAVVAGPMPRELARRAAAELGVAGLVDQVAFFAALRDPGVPSPLGTTGAMAAAIEWQHAIERGRSRVGVIEVDGARVSVDRGRVTDVVAEGTSWAGVLPPVDADDADRPLTPGAAAEAMWIGRRVRPGACQPVCEILESWSPQ